MIFPLQCCQACPSEYWGRLARLILLALLVVLGAYAQTQQQSPQQIEIKPPVKVAPQDGQQETHPKIAVQVNTVSVLATVRDKHGKISSNLTKDDFMLEEDGRPQVINYFARENDLALRLGLLVDTSLSQRNVLEQERSASYSFLDHLLREDKDLAFVIHFDREVELLQDFTPSRPKLQAALQSLQTPQVEGGRGSGGSSGGGTAGGSNGGGGPNGGGRGSGHRGGGTLLYDAIYLASNELMSKQQGRKALIILSDGVDRGSKETLAEAIETAQRSDTVVYSILFEDEEGLMGPRDHTGAVVTTEAEADIPRRNDPTGRKSCSRFPRRPVGGCMKFRRKKQWTKSTGKLKKNYATSTAWGTHLIKIRDLVIIRFSSQPKTKTWSCKPGTGTTRPGKANSLAG